MAAVAGLVLVWVAVSISYLRALRQLLAQREAAVVRELEAAEGHMRAWGGMLSEAVHYEWRQSANALERLLSAVDSEGRLATRIAAVRELPQVVSAQRSLLARDPLASPPPAENRLNDLDRALDRIELAVNEYNAAAADAAFACQRPPLSLFATVVRLRERPAITR